MILKSASAAFASLWLVACGPTSPDADTSASYAEVAFRGAPESGFSAEEQTLIRDAVAASERRFRAILPDLTEDLRFEVELVDRDLSAVGGVSGRAEAPGLIIVEFSSTHAGGVAEAVESQLPAMLFHEMHHQVRGWTINGNAFGPGIAIAVVNEGLADVFAEEFTGIAVEMNAYPPEVADWAVEVKALPVDANYGEWMFSHPDGREAIGYRVGRYLVHQAMANSGLDILALSELSPDEIWDLSAAS